jgi:CheY-like chemotaxis protein
MRIEEMIEVFTSFTDAFGFRFALLSGDCFARLATFGFVNRSKEKLLIIEKNEMCGRILSSVLQRADYSVTRVYSFPDAEAELKKQPGDFFNLFIIARPEILTENVENPDVIGDAFVMDFVHRVREQYEWNAPVLIFTENPENYPMQITVLARGPVEFFSPDIKANDLLDLIEKFFVPPAGLDGIKSILLEAQRTLKENASKESIEGIIRELKIAVQKQWRQDYTHPHSQYRQGLVSFDTAVRRLSDEKLSLQQLEALLESLELLKKRPLTYAELDQSDSLLLDVGINTMIELEPEDLERYLRNFFI